MKDVYVLNLKKKRRRKPTFQPMESSLIFRTETEYRQPKNRRIYRETIVFKTIEAKASSVYPLSLTKKHETLEKKTSRDDQIRRPKPRYRELETSMDTVNPRSGKWLSFQQRSNNASGIQDIFKRMRYVTNRRKRYASLENEH